MKTKARGRPPKDKVDRRTNVLRILLTEAERKAIDVNAQADSMETSSWVRTTILKLIGINMK